MQNGFYADNGGRDFFYCISNHVNCLDLQGEWAFDEDNDILYLYSTADPTDSLITYSRNGDIISISSNQISIENIQFTMSNGEGINADGISYLNINNCKLNYLMYGIEITNSNECLIEKCSIDYCLTGGIRLGHDNASQVRDNLVTRINIHPGEYQFDATGRAIGVLFEYIGGQYLGCNATGIYRNRIDNIGSSGIVLGRSNNCSIDSNYITNASRWLSDYDGGIYQAYNSETYWVGTTPWAGNWIRNNYVDLVETYSQSLGRSVASETYQAVHCIYSDNYSENTYIENNVVKGGRNGLLSHWNDTMTYRGNIVWNKNRMAFYVSGRGRNFTVEDNIFISPDYPGNPNSVWPMYVSNAPVDSWLSINRNYYLLPDDNKSGDNFIYTYDATNGSRTYNSIDTWEAESFVGDNEHTDVLNFEDVEWPDIDSMYFIYYNFSQDTVLVNFVYGGYYYSKSINVPSNSKDPVSLGKGRYIIPEQDADFGGTTGMTGTIFPDSVSHCFHYDQGFGFHYTFLLNNDKVYDFIIFGSKSSATANETCYSINGESYCLATDNNTDKTVIFSNVKPVNDSVVLYFSPGENMTIGYINAIQLVEKDMKEGTDFTQVEKPHILNVFPIPFNNLINIEFEKFEKGPVFIDFINSMGQTVLTDKLTEIDEDYEYRMNTSQLNVGVYILKIYTEHKSLALKRVVKI